MFYLPEPIMTALYNQVSTATSITANFSTISRRLLHWDQTPMQPAIFQVQPDDGMNYIWRPNNDPKVTMFVHFYIYTKTNDPAGVPSTLLNTAIGNLFQALETPAIDQIANSGRNTLSGLVYDCRINGKILTAEGVGSQKVQSLAVVPVEILVTH